MRSIFKYSDLIAGTTALVGAVVIFIFFMDINTNPTKSPKFYFTIKSGCASWAWFTYSLSSMLYYFTKSKGKKTSGGYMNPLFNLILKGMMIIPNIGLMLSLFSKIKPIMIGGRILNNAIIASSSFLNTVLIFFVLALFGAGINSIKSFLNKKC